MRRYWQGLGLAAVCGVLAVSYSVLVERRGTTTPAAVPEQQGYYVSDATIIDTGADGQPQWTLKAATIEQTLRDDSIALHTVQVDYAPDPNKRWLLTADSGHIPPDSRVIEFSGNVLVQPVGQERSMTLRTSTLRVDAEHNIASTQADVEVEMNRQRLNARGLWADLKRESVRLESRVHGEFDAP
jgi:LPS export ABC transporter protein LptC